MASGNRIFPATGAGDCPGNVSPIPNADQLRRFRMPLALLAVMLSSACTQSSVSGYDALRDVANNSSLSQQGQPETKEARANSGAVTALANPGGSEGDEIEENPILAAQKAFVEQQNAMYAEQLKKQQAFIEENRKRTETQLALAGRASSVAAPANKTSTSEAEPPVRKASAGTSSRSAGNIVLNAPWKCVPDKLKSVVAEVSRRYGKVTVNSTHRSRKHNRRVRGARNSYHLRCQAVDFRVAGDGRAVYRFLRSHPHVGGLKRYRSGFFHIDTGPRRTWRG